MPLDPSILESRNVMFGNQLFFFLTESVTNHWQNNISDATFRRQHDLFLQQRHKALKHPPSTFRLELFHEGMGELAVPLSEICNKSLNTIHI